MEILKGSKDTSTEDLVWSGSGAEGREVLRPDIQNGDRSDPGGTGPPHSFQHCGGRSGKGGAAGGMSSSGGTSWNGMGVGGAQHFFIC